MSELEFESFSVKVGEHPSLKALAASTTAAFNIIGPWCTDMQQSGPQPCSAALQGIVAQAKIYADAINFSILAAKCSYTLAQEAINFADKRSNPKPWGSQSDQLLYLQGMVAVAREGKANTDKVCHKFMGVGSTVMRLIRLAKEEKELWKTAGILAVVDLETLEKGIPDLEKFLNCILLYVGWWSDMHIRQDATGRSSKLNVDEGYNHARLQSIKRDWEKLQADYRDYVREITVLQTCHPELAPELFSLRNFDKVTLEQLANICKAEKLLESSITKIKIWVGWPSNERITPKIKDYLAALKSGKRRSQDGENNSNKIITAIERDFTAESVLNKSLTRVVTIIASEILASTEVLGKFAEVCKAIHKVLLAEEKDKGSEGESSELPKHVLRKFGEAVRGDYSWWSDIVARQTRWQAIIASDEPYNEGRYRVLLVEWKRLQSEYRGYRQEILELEWLYPSEFEDLS